MTDAMRFVPASVSVQQGETVRFVVKNSGKVKHEMLLGTENELKEHYEVMKKNPDMEHADENMVTVAPGNSGEIVWQFTKGEQEGHAEVRRDQEPRDARHDDGVSGQGSSHA